MSQRLETFADTAALISQLDLVISVDTSVAHLAGALGRPVWIALPFTPDWRWQMHRSDSPWYPQARLFRQSARGDWTDVVNAIASALDAWTPARPIERVDGLPPIGGPLITGDGVQVAVLGTGVAHEEVEQRGV